MNALFSQPRLLHLLAGLIALCGAGLIYTSTVWGIGVSPDSAEYINGARQLVDGAGLLSLPSHWAPGYSLLVALGGLFSDDLLFTTRLLQCLLYGLTLYASTLLLATINHSRSPLMVLGSVLFLSSAATYTMHFFAWSEGPFLIAQLFSAQALLCYWRYGASRYLFIAAALAAVAMLLRYAGIAWVGASALALLFIGPGQLLTRFKRAVGYGLLAIAPLALWLLVSYVSRSETTNREFIVHLINGDDLLTLGQLFYSWLGSNLGPVVFAVELCAISALLWLGLRSSAARSTGLQHFAWLTLIYVVVYTVFILLTKSFLDAYIPLDERIFIPVFGFFFLLLMAVAASVLSQANAPSHKPALRALAGLTVLALVLINARALAPQVRSNGEQGLGYLSAGMAGIASLDEVPALQGKTLYSNAPEYIALMSSLKASKFPYKYLPDTQQSNSEFGAQIQAIANEVLSGSALLVYYEPFAWREYYPSLAQLQSMGFTVLMSGPGVQILGRVSPEAPEQ